MPIYSYICVQCKKAFDYFHVNSKDKAECPHCGNASDHEKQVAKGTSFQLKGRGWARDKYSK